MYYLSYLLRCLQLPENQLPGEPSHSALSAQAAQHTHQPSRPLLTPCTQDSAVAPSPLKGRGGRGGGREGGRNGGRGGGRNGGRNGGKGEREGGGGRKEELRLAMSPQTQLGLLSLSWMLMVASLRAAREILSSAPTRKRDTAKSSVSSSTVSSTMGISMVMLVVGG